MIKKPWSDSFWKHLHPSYLTAEMIRFTHTFCLGGLTFLLFLILNSHRPAAAILLFTPGR